MTPFDESAVRRGGDTSNRGRFSAKGNSAPSSTLSEQDLIDEAFGGDDFWDPWSESSPEPAPRRVPAPIAVLRPEPVPASAPSHAPEPAPATTAPRSAHTAPAPSSGAMGATEAKRLAQDLMRKHGLDGWSFTFNQATYAMGKCNYRKREISMSRTYAEHATEAQVRDTMLHEIAHAQVGPGHGHGTAWKVRAMKLGARPSSTGRNPYADKVREEMHESATSLPAGAPEPERYEAGMRVVIKDGPRVKGEHAGRVFVVKKRARKYVHLMLADRPDTIFPATPDLIRAHREGEDPVRVRS